MEQSGIVPLQYPQNQSFLCLFDTENAILVMYYFGSCNLDLGVFPNFGKYEFFFHTLFTQGLSGARGVCGLLEVVIRRNAFYDFAKIGNICTGANSLFLCFTSASSNKTAVTVRARRDGWLSSLLSQARGRTLARIGGSKKTVVEMLLTNNEDGLTEGMRISLPTNKRPI